MTKVLLVMRWYYSVTRKSCTFGDGFGLAGGYIEKELLGEAHLNKKNRKYGELLLMWHCELQSKMMNYGCIVVQQSNIWSPILL